jgi:hypothetical protein
MYTYTNEEYADINFIYKFCNGNVAAAVQEYKRRFLFLNQQITDWSES